MNEEVGDDASSEESLEDGDGFPWQEFTKAYVHPMQLRLFQLIKERGEASPVELSRFVGVELAKVSHHIRSLKKHGMIEQSYTRAVRGAIKHGYRVVTPKKDDDDSL